MGTWNKIKSNPPSGFLARLLPLPVSLSLFHCFSISPPDPQSLFLSLSLFLTVSNFPFMILFFSLFMSLWSFPLYPSGCLSPAVGGSEGEAG